MPTERQIAANRKNAKKSTGPNTPLGIQVASRNAVKHGFYGTSVLLSDEDRNEFLQMARRFAKAFAPVEALEEECVKTIIETSWQLRRANIVDTELFAIFGFYKGEDRGVGTAFAHDAVQGNAFTKSTKYQTFLLKKLALAKKELEQLQTTRASNSLSIQIEATDTKTNLLIGKMETYEP